MFAYIKGTLASAHPTYVIIETNGIGYSLFIPYRIFGELPPLGQTAQFFTTFVVRESSQTLYGFLSRQERDVFEILMNVSGIGPKLALSLIGHLTFQELETAVSQQDLPTLCRVPGVGKKTAERLIVELKDKLPNCLPISSLPLAIPISDLQSQCIRDAMHALINLGYTQIAAQKAVKQSMQELSDASDLPLLITTALQNIRPLA